MVLLDLGLLVVDVEGGDDALGEHPGSKASWRLTADTSLEDQGDLVGTPEIEVVTDHLLEEDPPAEGPVEGLGQGELGLEDRDVVAITGAPVRPAEWVGQETEPLTHQTIDVGGARAGRRCG